MAQFDEGEYKKYMLPVLSYRDCVLVKGKGSYVWDTLGQKYLDLNSGQYCAIFGHSDEGLASCISNITHTIQDTDTSTLSVPVLKAAKYVHDISGEMNGRVLFLSTGAEANECCLKYAKHLKERPGIVSFDLGYHGLSHGTAGYSMSRDRIRPPLQNSYSIPAPCPYHDDTPSVEECLASFEALLKKNGSHIAAAIFEPIISGGGFYFPPKAFFQGVRALCDEYDIYLIFDECQTCMGRTGTWFYFQQLDCIPDFVVCAKSLGLGYPVSCVIANGNTIQNEQFVMQHFSSHQNEPFSGELIHYGIHRIEQEGLLERNRVFGDKLLDRLNKLCDRFPIVSNPRGKGLMCAFDLGELMELTETESKNLGEKFCDMALQEGVMLQHCNFGRTIRLLPNYLISDDDLDYFEKKMISVLSKLNG
ncbi:aspartate aminotransferase family protein [Neptuniibacter sp.]|uniref:class-III pyridoxal-phosphate-dependent aminotransferase n=1 Tax=Neptuniibacter sp. TaxID=1962643 RepID=UPI003B5B22A3